MSAKYKCNSIYFPIGITLAYSHSSGLVLLVVVLALAGHSPLLGVKVLSSSLPKLPDLLGPRGHPGEDLAGTAGCGAWVRAGFLCNDGRSYEKHL